MSADLLRQAAALMRSRAEAASPSPWPVGAENLVALPMVKIPRRERPFVPAGTYELAGPDDATTFHIASWHPAVALAVADLLEVLSWFPSSADPTDLKVAERVARAYLGGRGARMTAAHQPRGDTMKDAARPIKAVPDPPKPTAPPSHKQQVNTVLRTYAASLKAARTLHSLGVPGSDLADIFRAATEKAVGDLARLEEGAPS